MLHGITASVDAPAPTISSISGAVPGAAINETYSAQLSAVGGVPPYTWSVASGALPDGLSLSSSTGAITGAVPTGTTEQYYSFTVEAEDSIGQTKQRALEIGVGHYIVLLHMNGSNGGTTFTDQTGRSWTRNGNAQTVTEAGALGGSAGSFDGSGDYLTTAHDTDMRPTTDMTIEGRFYPDSVSTQRVIYTKRSMTISQDFEVTIQATGQLRVAAWAAGNNAVLVLDSTDLAISSQWNHFAISVKSGVWSMHLNGKHQISDTPSGTLAFGSTIAYIGRTPQFTTRDYDGLLNEIRWLRGAARYAEDEDFDADDVALSDYPVVP